MKNLSRGNKNINRMAKEAALSMGRSHKSERAKAKVIMRQLTEEVVYVCGEAERLGPLISLAVAEELVGDYSSARKYYEATFEIASGIAKVMEKDSAAYGGLADAVQNAIRHAQAGVLEIQLRDITAEYFRSIDNKVI